MALKIEETFDVQAPIARVWEYLIDPQRVVTCLPGAELTEVKDEQTYEGRIRVKVGPVTASYKGTARLEETDEAQHLMRMTGEGRETTGSGSAQMTMTSRLVELPDGGTQVRVEAEVNVVGRIVQFGRGLMEEVSRQLFKQFASCVQAQLAEGQHAGTEAVAPPAPRDDAPPTAKPEPGGGSASTAAVNAAPDVAAAATAHPPVPPRPSTATTRAPAPAEVKPVSALPLLFKALAAWIGRLFGRSA
jgi:carbon monoxide dehydrogenase subunit G